MVWRHYGNGLTENGGHENDGPSKLQGMKLQDVKITDQFAQHEIAGHEIARQEIAGHENAGHENDGQKWRQCAKLQENKQSLLTVCKFLTQNTVIHCAYGFIPACAQVGRLSPLYFNLWYFSNRCSRLQRSNAKSTQSIQPQTFAASVSVSYPALLCPAISCLAISCPAHWSVNFTSSIFSAPTATSADKCDISFNNGCSIVH